MNTKPNTAAIVQAAAEKSRRTRERILHAIEALRAAGKPVTVDNVAQTAQVFKSVLYDPKHSDLASLIRRLNQEPKEHTPRLASGLRSAKTETAKDVQISRLTVRVKQLENQVRELLAEREVLYGKLLQR